jgi:predicted nuclease of predicted toxin-antitoxin system
LDENVDPAVADGLRRRGVDVSTSQESGLLEAPDDRQLAFAVAECRVLVMHDDDFLALAKARVPHAGIAYCHPQSRSIGQIIAGPALDPRLPDF